jgi:uncharacterized cupredoxin-like copper-binding protein
MSIPSIPFRTLRNWTRCCAAGIAMLLAGIAGGAGAAGDLTRQEPVLVRVQLGTPEGAHRFVPSALKLETGRLYRLRLDNPSPHDYYFFSAGLADSIFSRKVVVVGDGDRALAEIYGPVRRLEVKAGASVEWWFVPVRTGSFDDLMSTRSHTQAGMTGTIQIE